MKKLRKSEWIFTLIGLGLMLGSLFVLYTGFSLVSLKRQYFAPSDPYQGSYSVMPTPTPTPPLGEVEEKPTASKADSLKEEIFLLFPANQAILSKTGSQKKGYPLRFRFEIKPKEAQATFELTHEKKPIILKPLKGSPTGGYEIGILIRKPGDYSWQVRTQSTESELRTLKIKTVDSKKTN